MKKYQPTPDKRFLPDYAKVSLCDGGIGRGVPFGIGMPQDTRRMGMVLAEKRVSFLEMLAEKYQTTTDKRFLPNHAKPSTNEYTGELLC